MPEVSESVVPNVKAHVDQIVSSAIEACWEVPDQTGLLMLLKQRGKGVIAACMQYGDHYFRWWQEKNAPSALEQHRSYFATYFWPECAKAFLVLWRDVLFELQRANILLMENRIKAEQYNELSAASHTTLTQAAQGLSTFLDDRMQQVRKKKEGLDQTLRKLRLQANPWPVYRQQFTLVQEQLETLAGSFDQLQQNAKAFESIRQSLSDTLVACRREITEQRQIAQRTIDSILTSSAETKAGKIAAQLEDTEAAIVLEPHLTIFSEAEEKQLALLTERIQVPVAVSGGLIQYKEINFRRSSRQWLDSEVTPVLYEIWELTEMNANGLKMSLLNIRNRVLVFASDQSEGKGMELDRKDLVLPMHAFIRKADATEQDLIRLQELIESRLEQHFFLSQIYQLQEGFLPVPLQSTINKLRVNQNALVVSLQDWGRRQTIAFSRFRRTVEIEETLSISEKVVRYLQHRNWDATNTHYNSLFLTKGYIGESFWVGRQDELEHIERLIDNWRNGFRGAVILSGQRLSGKSLMGELVSNRFFPQRKIHLSPQSVFQVQGRRKSTTCDLEEALTFIRKHTLNEPYLIWIDDLELWRDHQITLGRNVHALRRFIDDYSSRLFFLVSMGNSLRHHLDRYLDIAKVFQAEINLDRMPLTDIREAIMIRHGATHKELLDDKGREVSPKQFQQMTAKVYKAAHGNIGEALNTWAFSTEMIDDDRVKIQPTNGYALPDLISPESALILASIMLAKKTNEYRLRKLFGPAFSEKYRGALQRLISIGLLRRSADGRLEITEAAANDVGRLLEKKGYLRFQR